MTQKGTVTMKSDRYFDERQLRVRGDIFRHGWFVCMALIAGVAVVSSVWPLWLSWPFAALLIITCSAVVVSVEAIWRGAYLPLGPRGTRMRRMWNVLGLGYAIAVVALVVASIWSRGWLVTGGALTDNGVALVCYLMFLAIPAAIFLASRRDDRAARAYDGIAVASP
jgi:hypothetical protein